MSDAIEKAPGLSRRSKFLAVLMALFVLPAGFAYVRRLGYGIGLVFASPLLMFIAGRMGLPFTPSGYYALLAVLGLLLLGYLVLAFHFARTLPVGAAPCWYNCWYHYVWIAALGAVIGNVMLANRGALFGYDTFRISSTAMQPTLMVGDFVMADTRAKATGNIQRGDIVIYVPVDRPGEVWVKRVIGLPGEAVRMIGNDVEIDGKPLAESWMTIRDREFLGRVQYPSALLGDDEYFLLGDDRPNSIDSRLSGPVSRAALRGKVRAVWFHFSPQAGMDTSRIGGLSPANSH